MTAAVHILLDSHGPSGFGRESKLAGVGAVGGQGFWVADATSRLLGFFDSRRERKGSVDYAALVDRPAALCISGVTCWGKSGLVVWDSPGERVVVVSTAAFTVSDSRVVRLPSPPWSAAFLAPDSVLVNLPTSGALVAEYGMLGAQRRVLVDVPRPRSPHFGHAFISADPSFGIFCTYMCWPPRGVRFGLDGTLVERVGFRHARRGWQVSPAAAKDGCIVFALAAARAGDLGAWLILCASGPTARRPAISEHPIAQSIVLLADSGAQKEIALPPPPEPRTFWRGLAAAEGGRALLCSRRFVAEAELPPTANAR